MQAAAMQGACMHAQLHHNVLLLAQPPCRRSIKRKRGCSRGHLGVHAASADQAASLQKLRPEYIPHRIDDPNYVRVFDTTLRDGEQSPGASMSSKQKLDIARMLSKLGVDIIEAGFPVASPNDFEAVRTIAMEVGNAVDQDGYVPVICGLARTRHGDLDAAWEAVRHARRPRVHTFIATSPIHMQYKLKMTPDQVVESAVSAVQHLRSLGCTDIEFSPEDASRSDIDFLYRILGEVIKAGATTVNIPDTTGWALPQEFGKRISDVIANTPGASGVVVSTHCQNDLGLATANSLAGAALGARQVECTINGIGERAGNASLEEIVMAIDLRGPEVMGGLRTGIRPGYIAATSKMVTDCSGMMIQPHKAIVGANAFQHASGVHQDGMLKNKQTYEIMSPEYIGLVRGEEFGITLGKLSGKAAVMSRLKTLGYDDLTKEQSDDVFRRFKDVADMKKEITDEDLLALITDEVNQPPQLWALVDLQVVCGTMGLPTATVRLRGPDDMERTATGMGTGPVDASYKAIDALVQVPVDLVDYGMNSVSQGIEAMASTRVVIRPMDGSSSVTPQGRAFQRTFAGTGADDDVVVSSARAYISALNKLISFTSASSQAVSAQQRGQLNQQQPNPVAV